MKREIHGKVSAPYGELTMGDITDQDVIEIARYLTRPDPHLDRLMQREKLGPYERIVSIFEQMARTGNPDQHRIAFSIHLDDRFIGFTTLARRSPEENYSHWHICATELRGSGISSDLYLARIRMYFDLYPIRRLIHQTKPWNVGVNRMLDKFVPASELKTIHEPDGLAWPGEFIVRYVYRDSLPNLLAPLLQKK
jgi:hypothetical protein